MFNNPDDKHLNMCTLFYLTVYRLTKHTRFTTLLETDRESLLYGEGGNRKNKIMFKI